MERTETTSGDQHAMAGTWPPQAASRPLNRPFEALDVICLPVRTAPPTHECQNLSIKCPKRPTWRSHESRRRLANSGKGSGKRAAHFTEPRHTIIELQQHPSSLPYKVIESGSLRSSLKQPIREQRLFFRLQVSQYACPGSNPLCQSKSLATFASARRILDLKLEGNSGMAHASGGASIRHFKKLQYLRSPS